MSELQAEQEQLDLAPEVSGETDVPSTEELAPSTEAEQQTPQETPEEKAQKAINKQHFKYQQQKRENEKVQAELAAAKKQLEELQRTPEPQVPPRPDPFDAGFEEQLAVREAAIAAKAKYDYEQRLAHDEQTRIAQEAQQAQEKALQDKVHSYSDNARKLGVDPIALQQAGQAVQQHGIPDKVSLAILEDSEGALMTQYLAANPNEIYEMHGMTDWQMYNKVSEIKAKASQLKPKTTNAPPPADTLSGNSTGELQDPLIQGATFE